MNIEELNMSIEELNEKRKNEELARLAPFFEKANDAETKKLKEIEDALRIFKPDFMADVAFDFQYVHPLMFALLELGKEIGKKID